MFVQFPHPGLEHRPTGPFMGWNRGEHARKFLHGRGSYLARGTVRRGDLLFWGEWEPPSRVVRTFPTAIPDGPRFVHDPVREMPRHRSLLQNTDPLVFGERFLYSNCRQSRNRRLRQLAQGSVIIFGSDLHSEFVLDTVFVVSRAESFTRATTAVLSVEPWIRTVVFDPLSRSSGLPAEPFRLYWGRGWDEALGGPFSFVPCVPSDSAPRGFARPVIGLDRRWITPGLRQGAKATAASEVEIRAVWLDVVEQVTAQGLDLGVSFDVPPDIGEGVY
jgi:hypothetical protein